VGAGGKILTVFVKSVDYVKPCEQRQRPVTVAGARSFSYTEGNALLQKQTAEAQFKQEGLLK
jgi:hypothetical protein